MTNRLQELHDYAWEKEWTVTHAAKGQDEFLLLITGWRTSADTVRSICEFLNKHLLWNVHRIALDGMDGSREKFLRSYSWNWVPAAEKEFLSLYAQAQKEGKKIWVVGYSAGALVALILAARHPEKVEGVVSVNGALRLANAFNRLFLWCVYHLYFSLGDKWPKIRKRLKFLEDLIVPDVGEQEPEVSWAVYDQYVKASKRLHVMKWLPFYRRARQKLKECPGPREEGWKDAPGFNCVAVLSASTLLALQREAYVALRKLKAQSDVWIAFIHGDNDYVADLRAVKNWHTYVKYGKGRTFMVVYKGLGHRITLPQTQRALFQLIAAFIHRKRWEQGERLEESDADAPFCAL